MTLSEIKKQYSDKDQSLYGSDRITDLLALLYQENSKLDKFTSRAQGEAIQYFQDPYITQRIIQPHKVYPTPLKKYSQPVNILSAELLNALKSRRSTRAFDPSYKISLNELLTVFYYSYGIVHTSQIPTTDYFVNYRPVPSAGGLYPLELYVSLFRSSVEKGLYHFQEVDTSIELLKNGIHLQDLRGIINAEPYVAIGDACGVIFITSLIERVCMKYGERGYKFILQEVGYVSMAMSLLFEQLGLGSCLIGSYLDDQINEYLEIDGVYENIQAIIVFGKKAN